MKKFECHVISNTHWDREWLKPFQVYRMRFVDYCDQLLDMLEENPEYRHYHLDSQSITLEDYLEIRPENRLRIKRLVESGKLLIGPWYDLPDMNMVDGECLVRNLLRGHRLCAGFGGAMKVGYTPTSAGQIAQLPQIYQGFSIDSAIFYRGNNRETTPTEYFWRSPDGSEVIGIRPARFSRANFWVHCILPVVHGMFFTRPETCDGSLDAEQGRPFRIADTDENSYLPLTPPRFYNQDVIKDRFQQLMDDITPEMTTLSIPAFDGHDHNSPHPETPAIIADINTAFPEMKVRHSSLPKYIDAVRKQLTRNRNTTVVEGEMRHTNHSVPGAACLYPGSLTTRIYLKQENRKIENLLLRQTEPASVLAAVFGLPYPVPYLDLAWRLLLTNQSHDCMMGCSIDKVHEDMMHRFSEAGCIAEELLKRSLAAVTANIDLSSITGEGIALVCFNLQTRRRGGLVRITVDLPPESGGNAIVVRDADGKALPVQMISSFEENCRLEGEGFLKSMKVRRHQAYVLVEEVPATGYCAYSVEATEAPEAKPDLVANQMENEFLRVSINADGTFDLFCKSTGALSHNLNSFEDHGEIGNAWVPKRPQQDRCISSRGGKAEIRCIEAGALRTTYETKVTMRLPVSATADLKSRSRQGKNISIISRLSLSKNNPCVEIETCIQNTVRDHKLRALFPSGVKKAQNSYAATPFAVTKRPIRIPDGTGWIEPPWSIYPNYGFVDVSDTAQGLAVLNQGLLEYEVFDDAERTLALTLIKGIWQRGNGGGKAWPDTGFQCLGEHHVNYAVYPHAGNWQTGNVYQQLDAQCAPLRMVQCTGKSTGKQPCQFSLLEISPETIQVSALKTAEDNPASALLRVFNPAPEPVQAEIRVGKNCTRAQLLDLEEKLVEELKTDGQQIKLLIPPHKIFTIKLEGVLK